MTEAESQDIKAALMAHMKANPVKQEKNFFASLMRPMRMAVSTLSVVLVAGVGVSYAAEASLPGELLYPVKVNVMEEVVSTLKINKEAKAEYEVERAEKRLEEAIELAEEGELTPELEAKVWGQLEQQAEKVEGLAVELEVNEHEKSQNIRSNWNKLIVENEAIVVQLVMEDPVVVEEAVVIEETVPEVIEAIDPVEALETVETPIVEAIPSVIEVLPSIATEPVEEVISDTATADVLEVEPSVEAIVEEPTIEVLPEVTVETVEVIEEPVIDVTTIVEEPVIEEEVVTVEVTNPTLDENGESTTFETDSTVIVAPVVETVEEETVEIELSPILIESGLIMDTGTRIQLQLNRRR